jgi:hypothetical protein
MRKKKRAGGIKKELHRLRLGHPAGDYRSGALNWAATSSRPPATSQRLTLCILFQFNFLIFFGKFRKWARDFGRMGIQHTHFLKLAPTLGSVKSSIPHGDWRFHFF